MGVGDFDSDGQNEIAVLWQGDGCRIAGPACRTVPHLSVLRYSNTGRARSVAVLQADVPLPAALLTGSPAPDMGFQVAVDDFDGQGQDQLAFSFIAQDAALAVLGFARGDEQFTVSRFGRDPGDWALSAYCPENACTPEAAGAVPQLAAGLFWYDEQSGHGLGRRQLALTALLQVNEQGYGVGLQVYDVAFDPTTCTSSLPCPLTLSGLFDAKQVGDGAALAAQRQRRRAVLLRPAHVLPGRRELPGAGPEPQGREPDPLGARRRDRRRPGPPGRERPGDHLLPAVRQPGGPVQARHPVPDRRRGPVRGRGGLPAAGLRPGGGLPQSWGPRWSSP